VANKISKMFTQVTSFPIQQASDDIQSVTRWIFETIRPFIKGRTLEINSGTISLCPLFIGHNRPIHLSATKQFHLQALREAYKGNGLIRSIHDFDFTAADFRTIYPETLDVFDTVIALDVAMTDFTKMAENIKYVLPKGGTLAMILPAYTSIYHGLDQNLADWKRYNKKPIREILRFSFSILKVRYFILTPDPAKDIFAHSGLSALLTVKKN
jgi:hypothetical protein